MTVRWLQGLGWNADQCQRQQGPVKHDLFGVADQYAFAGGLHVWIQSTTAAHLPERRRKVLTSEYAVKWKRDYAGNLIYLFGWQYRNLGNVPRVEEIQWDHMTARLVAVPIQDPAAELDVQDPQGLARARGKT